MTASLLALSLLAAPPAPFELKDGDRIVWVGGAPVEREQRYGYWEAALPRRFPDRNVTVRNLGWSGDDVFGTARAAFDPVAKGYERLVALTLELKPTVVFVSYGTNESFEGEAGLERFEKGLTKLLDDLKPSKARVVLFTPLPFEPSSPALRPNRNKDLALYRDRIRAVAAARGDTLADLFAEPFSLGLTTNGMHLSRDGYEHTAASFLASLGLASRADSAEAERLEPCAGPRPPRTSSSSTSGGRRTRRTCPASASTSRGATPRRSRSSTRSSTRRRGRSANSCWR